MVREPVEELRFAGMPIEAGDGKGDSMSPARENGSAISQSQLTERRRPNH
jgi:hypothetical protein